MNTNYVIGRHTFDDNGFVNGTLYYRGVRVLGWSKKLYNAYIFDDESLAIKTLDWLKGSSDSIPNKDSQVWSVNPKRLFEARLKG